MYCSTCGVAVAEKLSYCNHCGARLTSNSDNAIVSRDVKPESLISAMAASFVFGLIAISVLLGVMKSVLGFELGQLLAFATLSFLMLLGLEGVFLRLLLRPLRGAEERARKELPTGHTTKDLAAPQAQLLREPLSSVTDETTRAFEPVYTNRNKPT